MKNYAKELMSIKDVNKRNKAFNNLTRAEKRIAIAQETLNVKSIRNVTLGSRYFMTSTSNKTLSLQDFKPTQECTLCEGGLLLFSRARLGDEVVFEAINYFEGDLNVVDIDRVEAFQPLSGIFKYPELRVLEKVFESLRDFNRVIPFDDLVKFCHDLIIELADEEITTIKALDRYNSTFKNNKRLYHTTL